MLVSWHRSDGSMQRPSRVARNWRSEPAGASGRSSLMTVFLVALEDLVAGLARNAECATDLAHRFAVQQPSDKLRGPTHPGWFRDRQRRLCGTARHRALR